MPIPLGILAVAGAGAAGGNNWFVTLAGGDGNSAEGVRVDTSGNVYNGGWHIPTGLQTKALIVKYNSSGNVLWQRKLDRTSQTTEFKGIDVDSSSNVYVVGYTDENGYDILFAKYNSSGAIQWQRRLGGSSDDIGYGLRANSSGDIYFTGYHNNGTRYGMLNAKFNTSATQQWQNVTTWSSGSLFPTDFDMDSSDNIYFTGQASPDSGFSQIYVGKMNSSGTIQWLRRVSTGTDRLGQGVTVDSNGNVYVFSQTFSNSTMLQKWSSSGVLDWGRQLDGGTGINARSLTRDSSNNLYALGTLTISGITKTFIAKYNSSGTIQWQRQLGTSVAVSPFNIHADTNGFIQVSGNFGGGLRAFTVKLPADGTGTGTYTFGAYSLTYEASSLTDGSISTGDTAGGTSTSSSSLTLNTPTYTDAATTLTEEKVSF